MRLGPWTAALLFSCWVQVVGPAYPHQGAARVPFEQLYGEGVRLFQQGDWDAAERAFRKLIELAPRVPEPYLFLGRLAAVRGAREEAKALLGRALELKPDFVEAHHTLGVLYLEQQDFARAYEEFSTVLRLDPRRPLAFVNLGTAAFRLGKLEAAAAHFEKALDLRPEPPVVVLAAAQFSAVCLELGRSEQARRAFEEAVRLRPGDEALQLKLGEAYEALGRELAAKGGREGLELFRDYARRFPARPMARILLGEALLRSQDLPGALAEFEQAVALDPALGRAHFSAGFAYKELGDAEKARRALETARRLEPQNPLVLFHLADLASHDEDPTPALRLLERALAANPDYAEAYVKVGQIHVRSKRFRQAVGALMEAVRLEPELPQAHYLLSRAYLGLGESDKAARERRRFQELEQKRHDPRRSSP